MELAALHVYDFASALPQAGRTGILTYENGTETWG
jgi:hypothetical protein